MQMTMIAISIQYINFILNSSKIFWERDHWANRQGNFKSYEYPFYILILNLKSELVKRRKAWQTCVEVYKS